MAADDGITEYQGQQIIRLLESILSELQDANSHLFTVDGSIDRIDDNVLSIKIDVESK